MSNLLHSPRLIVHAALVGLAILWVGIVIYSAIVGNWAPALLTGVLAVVSAVVFGLICLLFSYEDDAWWFPWRDDTYKPSKD